MVKSIVRGRVTNSDAHSLVVRDRARFKTQNCGMRVWPVSHQILILSPFNCWMFSFLELQARRKCINLLAATNPEWLAVSQSLHENREGDMRAGTRRTSTFVKVPKQETHPLR